MTVSGILSNPNSSGAAQTPMTVSAIPAVTASASAVCTCIFTFSQSLLPIE